jgi:NAD(P)H-dependent flavin oxidoreductase YrpB (nitropropane dioxygenase family)
VTTPLCELLGIERPIVQAPMSDIVAELTSGL